MQESNIYKKLFEVKKAWIKLQRDTSAFNYKYATLSQIQEKFWEVLQEQGLLVAHSVVRINGQSLVKTAIIDIETERSLASEIPLSEWTKPQDKWSEITYYRRYNLLSLLDLEVEDDDWKKAQDSKPTKYTEDDNKQWFNDENYDKLSDLISDWKTFTLKDIRNKYKVSKANAEKIKELWIK
jgi:hypothetical protein